MNILIKGLEIPENGYLDVRILNHGSVDAVTSTGSHPYYIAHDVVVLPEKHGRLIDADALFEAMKYSNWKVLFSSDGTFLDISKFSEIIRNIPTVIEAESEG